MDITEVKLTRVKGDDKLQAFVRVTFDNAFVVKELKIISGKKGMFVAMPSRKLMEHCQKCGKKNPVFALFCNNCGAKQIRKEQDQKNKKVYADIAHPINSDCRTMIQEKVLEAFDKMMDEEGEDNAADIDVAAADTDDIVRDEDETSEEKTEKGTENDNETDDDSDDFSDGIW